MGKRKRHSGFLLLLKYTIWNAFSPLPQNVANVDEWYSKWWCGASATEAWESAGSTSLLEGCNYNEKYINQGKRYQNLEQRVFGRVKSGWGRFLRSSFVLATGEQNRERPLCVAKVLLPLRMITPNGNEPEKFVLIKRGECTTQRNIVRAYLACIFVQCITDGEVDNNAENLRILKGRYKSGMGMNWDGTAGLQLGNGKFTTCQQWRWNVHVSAAMVST